jgi:hypothetical protein
MPRKSKQNTKNDREANIIGKYSFVKSISITQTN